MKLCGVIWCDFVLKLLTFYVFHSTHSSEFREKFHTKKIFQATNTPTLYVFDLWFSKNGYKKKEKLFNKHWGENVAEEGKNLSQHHKAPTHMWKSKRWNLFCIISNLSSFSTNFPSMKKKLHMMNFHLQCEGGKERLTGCRERPRDEKKLTSLFFDSEQSLLKLN